MIEMLIALLGTVAVHFLEGALLALAAYIGITI